MTEDAKQKLVDILSKSPDLIGQDSSFFGSANKPNEANLKLFMKFARGLKNSGTLSKETVDINKFINFLSKNGKSEEELGKIRSSFEELSSRSQVVETDTESTLFDVADALLVYGVKGDKTISKFQTALKSLSAGSKSEEGTEEGSQEKNPVVNTVVAPSTVDQEGAKKDTPPEDSSYSGGSYDEGGGSTESTPGGATESATGAKTETKIGIDSKTKATTVLNTESTVKKYPDLPQTLIDIKPKELTDKEGKLIGFISDDESNKSVYDQSGEIIGQIDPTDKSVGGSEGLSVVLKPKAPATPETAQKPTAPVSPQAPQLREPVSKKIPIEGKGPVTGPTSKVPTGLGAGKLADIPPSFKKGKKKTGSKRVEIIGERVRKLSPQPNRTQKATATKGKGKAEQAQEESPQIPINSRQTQGTANSGGGKKKKGGLGKKVGITGGALLAGTIGATMPPATAVTVAGEIFKQIIQIIT